MRAVALLAIAFGCRGYHPDRPFEECQPYALQCPTCTFADDAADAARLLRLWRCETTDGRAMDAATRVAVDEVTLVLLDAEDTRFYDADSGLRIAAVRRWDEPIDVCGVELDEEWYGEVLGDCFELCEYDPQLERADPELGRCPPVF
jgi:hypothetical protein